MSEAQFDEERDELFCGSNVYECYEDGMFGEQGTAMYVRLRDAWVADIAAIAAAEI